MDGYIGPRYLLDPELVEELNLPETPGGFRIDRLEIGSFTFTAPSAKPKNSKGISKGLDEQILVGIGSDLLSEQLLTVDYPRRAVLLGRDFTMKTAR